MFTPAGLPFWVMDTVTKAALQATATCSSVACGRRWLAHRPPPPQHRSSGFSGVRDTYRLHSGSG